MSQTAIQETVQTFLGLIDRARTLDTVGDALRILRDLLPAGAATEQARNLRKQVTLLRARLRDAAELERSGLRPEPEAREEEARLARFARDIAREVTSLTDPSHLQTAIQSLSLALSSREQAKSPEARQSAGQIFLSYRRADSAPVTGVLREHLVQRFGRSAVFMDIDSIPLGVNFRAHIVSTLASCKACLAIIGPKWVDARDDRGNRRLEDVDDPIRVELEVAMRIDRRVIPILVDGATMPRREDLPEAMRMLCSQNGFPLRPAGDFSLDVKRLLDLLEQQMF